jgi:hypothetical protein
MLPPLNFSSTAASDAKGGYFTGGANNALREGDWFVSTGSATGSTVPGMALAHSGSLLLPIALIAAAAWYLHKHKHI